MNISPIQDRATRLEVEFLDTVRRWGRSIECADEYTQRHSVRVADIACALGAANGMLSEELFWLRVGALLHDVGKLVLPTALLTKCGTLTADEWELVRGHPAAGVQMLAAVDFPWDIRPVVIAHHERWDGFGYPNRLAGYEIPRVARIVCIADVYDALTSERCYKRALPHAAAMDVMRADVGRQFDPAMFAQFEHVASRDGAAWATQAARARAARRTSPPHGMLPADGAAWSTGASMLA